MARPARRFRLPAVLVAAAAFAAAPRRTGAAGTEPFEVDDILEPPPAVELELVQTRITAYEQKGYGFQSQAGPLSGPGSETLHVLQAQAELVARQGERVTHRLWVPVDVVTSASANATDRYYAEPDIVSAASAQTFGAEAEYEISLHSPAGPTWSGGVGYHIEEILNSWRLSLRYEQPFAEDNTTLAVGVNQVLDWFNRFDLGGLRIGRASRSSTNLNVSVSQLLSPTTIVGVGYGVTFQAGELGNTYNTVPSDDGERVLEALPPSRRRNAASASLTQWLPWRGSLRLSYRFYVDDWAVTANSVETELLQRVLPWLVLGASYRYHDQSAASFFTTRGSAAAPLLSADSDLDAFVSQTVGGSARVDLGAGRLGDLFLSLGYDHYFRSNDLRVNVATWASGFRF
jgi:hypothetical protein